MVENGEQGQNEKFLKFPDKKALKNLRYLNFLCIIEQRKAIFGLNLIDLRVFNSD